MYTTGDLHVIRNAGGRVDESAIRSLVISQRLLGTKEVYIIHHTDCGAHTVSGFVCMCSPQVKAVGVSPLALRRLLNDRLRH